VGRTQTIFSFEHCEVAMSYAEMILPEFDEEMANTRKVLERVPDDKFDWKAHPKLNTIGWNANHVAEIPGWVEGIMAADSWDCAPVGGEPYQMPKFKSREEVLNMFDATLPAPVRLSKKCGRKRWERCGRC